jgi:hypothetical protein
VSSPLLALAVNSAIAATPKRHATPARIAYTFKDAAHAVGIPKSTLRDAHARGEFVAVKRCGRWIVLHDELLRWLADN